MDNAPLPAPAEEAKHVTIWNREEHRKVAGNAAPLRRNLEKYLIKHPECEEYTGQDKDPNRAPIDPITGRRIIHLNEHVPIWHTMENRKVTGNAAPLRKNLQAYLRKHPHCEVYNNQDKQPRHQSVVPLWGNSVPTQPTTTTVPTTAATLSPAVSAAFRRTGEPGPSTTILGPASSRARSSGPPPSSGPMRDVFYKSAYHPSGVETGAQPPIRYVYSAAGRSHQHASFGGPQQPFAPPPPAPPPGSFAAASPPAASPTPGTPSYADMVSSWSNQPEWTQPYPHAPGSFTGPPAVGTPQTSSLFSANMYATSAMDTGECNANAIPIPGRLRERQDIVMGASLGASLGTSAHFPGELMGYLGTTPRSMEHDPDLMQFSPSNFLSIGPPARSPPLAIPQPQARTTTLPYH